MSSDSTPPSEPPRTQLSAAAAAPADARARARAISRLVEAAGSLMDRLAATLPADITIGQLYALDTLLAEITSALDSADELQSLLSSTSAEDRAHLAVRLAEPNRELVDLRQRAEELRELKASRVRLAIHYARHTARQLALTNNIDVQAEADRLLQAASTREAPSSVPLVPVSTALGVTEAASAADASRLRERLELYRAEHEEDRLRVRRLREQLQVAEKERTELAERVRVAEESAAGYTSLGPVEQVAQDVRAAKQYRSIGDLGRLRNDNQELAEYRALADSPDTLRHRLAADNALIQLHTARTLHAAQTMMQYEHILGPMMLGTARMRSALQVIEDLLKESRERSSVAPTFSISFNADTASAPTPLSVLNPSDYTVGAENALDALARQVASVNSSASPSRAAAIAQIHAEMSRSIESLRKRISLAGLSAFGAEFKRLHVFDSADSNFLSRVERVLAPSVIRGQPSPSAGAAVESTPAPTGSTARESGQTSVASPAHGLPAGDPSHSRAVSPPPLAPKKTASKPGVVSKPNTSGKQSAPGKSSVANKSSAASSRSTGESSASEPSSGGRPAAATPSPSTPASSKRSRSPSTPAAAKKPRVDSTTVDLTSSRELRATLPATATPLAASGPDTSTGGVLAVFGVLRTSWADWAPGWPEASSHVCPLVGQLIQLAWKFGWFPDERPAPNYTQTQQIAADNNARLVDAVEAADWYTTQPWDELLRIIPPPLTFDPADPVFESLYQATLEFYRLVFIALWERTHFIMVSQASQNRNRDVYEAWNAMRKNRRSKLTPRLQKHMERIIAFLTANPGVDIDLLLDPFFLWPPSHGSVFVLPRENETLAAASLRMAETEPERDFFLRRPDRHPSQQYLARLRRKLCAIPGEPVPRLGSAVSVPDDDAAEDTRAN